MKTTLRNSLRHLRKEQNLTLLDVAKRGSWADAPGPSQVENLGCNPTLKTVERYVKALRTAELRVCRVAPEPGVIIVLNFLSAGKNVSEEVLRMKAKGQRVLTIDLGETMVGQRGVSLMTSGNKNMFYPSKKRADVLFEAHPEGLENFLRSHPSHTFFFKQKLNLLEYNIIILNAHCYISARTDAAFAAANSVILPIEEAQREQLDGVLENVERWRRAIPDIQLELMMGSNLNENERETTKRHEVVRRNWSYHDESTGEVVRGKAAHGSS